jgi:exodeoxyribonuclease V gamma subunit
MIQLTYSNRTEELLAALCAAVRAERSARGPWQPLSLVVPNRSVETYLKLGLCEALGIAANLQVSFLRGFLASLTEQALPGHRLGDALETEGRLLALLHDPAVLRRPGLAEVRDYIEGAGQSEDAIDRRRSQLAAELAELFDEYAVSRPEMLRTWRERPVHGGDAAHAAIEAWQRELWLAALAGPADAMSPPLSGSTSTSTLTLAELVRAIENRAEMAVALRGQSLHVFGVSYIGRAYHAALAAIARHAEVHLYTLNPCREFWEDIETVGELRRRLKRQGRETLFPGRAEARQAGLPLDDDPYGLLDDRESLALRLWGRPGRENIRLLNQQGGGDFQGRFVAHQPSDSGGASLLGRLQDDILDRVVPGGPDAALAADGSVRVIPCPGVRRELEVIAAEIWRLVDSDPTLRLNQIALVVPESVKETYLSHVGAVFAEAHELPHSIIDLPLSSGHRLGEAALALLDLPLGGTSRRELLPLLTHPALMGRFPDASPGDWLRLCDELGIVHGRDHQDHQGTYIGRDVLNWDQGIRRLCLGVLMDGSRSGEDPAGQPVSIGADGDSYLPVTRLPDEQRGALGFAALARSLLADSSFARGDQGGRAGDGDGHSEGHSEGHRDGGGSPRLRPLGEWLDFMRGLLTGYLVPTDADQEGLLGRLLTELDRLDDLPLGGTAISYRTAAELARRALRGVGGARGQYLAHGVTVTSFVPMRAIPFRVIFVAGLGQGSFPRVGRRSELDLRAVKRAPGDVSPREQDLYMFLETLLSARERLVLSYVARDELSGAPLAPSSVVLELRDVLRAYLSPAELARLFDPRDEEGRPALRRYDDRPRVRPGTLAEREQRAKALSAALRAQLPAGAHMPDLPTLRRAMPGGTFGELSARLGVLDVRPASATAAAPRAGRLTVPLSAIRQFLEDPLQGSARFRLRLREYEGDEELADRQDEHFEIERPLRTVLLREVMLRVMSAGAPSAEAIVRTLDDLVRREELRGRAPTGFFAAAQRPTLQAILGGWQAALAKPAPATAAPLTGSPVHFGRPSAHEVAVGVRRDPITLAVNDDVGEVQLVGRTELQVTTTEGPASLFFSCRSQSRDGRTPRHRDRLRAFVDHLALAAAGLGGGPHGALIAWSDGSDHELDARRFREVMPETARDYLAGIVSAMLGGARDGNGQLTGVHPYLLPCEAVFNLKGARAEGKRTLVEEIEKLRDDYLEKGNLLAFSSVNGPVPEAVERHDPPPLDEAERMVDERFGLYFALLEESSR